MMTREDQEYRQKNWPARYYAYYDHTAPQPTPVLGWLDVWGMGRVDGIPPASEMLPLTPEQWKNHPRQLRGVHNGAIIEHRPPPRVTPLPEQAEQAMAWVRQEAAMTAAMDQVFSPAMREYVAALRAIIAGTSTPDALPDRPTEITAPRAA